MGVSVAMLLSSLSSLILHSRRMLVCIRRVTDSRLALRLGFAPSILLKSELDADALRFRFRTLAVRLILVEPGGFEPPTPGLQSRCSPS